MKRSNLPRLIGAALLTVLLAAGAALESAVAQNTKAAELLKGRTYNGEAIEDLLSAGALMAMTGPIAPVGLGQGLIRGKGPMNGRGFNAESNDACLDALPSPAVPYPYSWFDVVQSETEIAVLNTPGSMGKKMVVGYNDSYGFTTNLQGLSGFSYSYDGGLTWIDGGGLPPQGSTDQYYGDPVVVVHHASETFYYSSIYLSPNGYFTISVNRGTFQDAPAGTPESKANFACLADETRTGIPTSPGDVPERIVWDAPFEAVAPPYLGPNDLDFLDKEWLYVDQNTGELYVTYTRFPETGPSTIEMVRSTDGGATWTAPVVIVTQPYNRFNQASQPVTTPSGRVIVSWFGRGTYVSNYGDGTIEVAYSDDDGATWSAPILVANVNTQAEPLGYNRQRASILNAPFIAADKGKDDGIDAPGEASRPGYGNVYITYFSARTPGGPYPTYDRAADIFVSTSTDDGATWGAPVKVNDDNTATSHLFSSVQVSKQGYVRVTWIDRRLDEANNIMTDTWAATSEDLGASFGENRRLSDVSASWYTRADARPNFGDYNSSDLIGFNKLISVWSDGRFRPPGNATFLVRENPSSPDVYVQIVP